VLVSPSLPNTLRPAPKGTSVSSSPFTFSKEYSYLLFSPDAQSTAFPPSFHTPHHTPPPPLPKKRKVQAKCGENLLTGQTSNLQVEPFEKQFKSVIPKSPKRREVPIKIKIKINFLNK
jgi:hypothetical protein